MIRPRAGLVKNKARFVFAAAPAIRMMADENNDSWGMGTQHALLCVKQARAFMLDEGNRAIIIARLFLEDQTSSWPRQK